MKLWGYQYNTEEHVPQQVPTDEKKNVYATQAGWTQLNNSGIEEVLVCFRGLAGSNSSTGLGAPNVMEVNLETRTANNSNVTLVVAFNEQVTVTGTPYITLIGDQAFAGGTGRASYVSGNGTNQLVFTYVPKATDNVALVTANTIVLNSGTIKDTLDANTPSNLNFNNAGYNNTTNVCPVLANAAVIEQDPYIMSIDYASTRATNAAAIQLTVNYSTPVELIGDPYIALTAGSGSFGGANGWLYCTSGNTTTNLVFTYTPTKNNGGEDDAGTLTANTIVLNSGTIKSVRNADNARVNFTKAGFTNATNVEPNFSTAKAEKLAAYILSVDSAPRASNLANVVLTVNYSEPVAVTGAPYVALTGNNAFAGNGWSYYSSGSATANLVFTYVPQATDNVSTITANTIVLNSGTIRDSANAVAKLNFNKAGYNKVTNVCPVMTGVVVIKP